ncbi:MAG: N-succinyl-L,L-diaminopimelate aminotransferase, type 2 [uncultured Rubrobacteraceae bacterium]|uniref:N-succinyl-L,L-diaminopimelate aminotransferase, type 2 n=1 Tax=uncultured Rubrobacteraceae bacterium TaxID=349277 RepID=A0A6J4R2K4_9ACTN|nr:MAG: N-succinyl-L,L-diaminopimelate aminotransferase, type 2 [uncultured Rubrobacteraceae bacterium]
MQIPNEQPAPETPPRLLLNPVLERMPTYPLIKMDERRRKLEESGATLYDFGTGDPREPTDAKIRRALVDAVPKTSRYPSATGTKALREAFAGFMRRRHNVELDPDTEVLPAAGSKEAIFHTPLAFLHPSHERRGVAYGTPGYPVYERGALFAGGEALPVKLRAEDGFLLPVSALDPARTRAVWINYPHNPTGATATHAYLEELAAFCREHDILLFSDECYNDVYSGAPPPSILEITRERTLAFVSLSKRSGMTGYRSAMMAGDPELIAALKKMRPSIGAASPTFVQRAATAAWNDDAHVEQRNRIFAGKRKLFTNFFEKAGFRWTPTNASLYLWAEVPEEYGGDDEAYALRLLEEGIIVASGSSFGPGGEGFFRIALVPTLEECEEAIARWEDLVR